jgi:hypothetical protein
VIFAGRFAVDTPPTAPTPVQRDPVGAGRRHLEGVPAVRFPVKIASDGSMQQTPDGLGY